MADRIDQLQDRLTRMECTVGRAVTDITDANIRRTTLRTEIITLLGQHTDQIKERIGEMGDKFDNHAKSDETMFKETTGCLQRIELSLATHKAGMKPWEKMLGAMGMAMLGILSTIILWKLGVK